jgi:hypothetical protein
LKKGMDKYTCTQKDCHIHEDYGTCVMYLPHDYLTLLNCLTGICDCEDCKADSDATHWKKEEKVEPSQ